MNTSPIVGWENATAHYTWADSPGALYFSLALMLAIVIGVIVQSARHERKSFKRAEGGK